MAFIALGSSDIIVISACIAAFIIGIPLNAFIMIVCVRSLMKDRQRNPTDLLLSALGLSNIIIIYFKLLSCIQTHFFSTLTISYSLYLVYGIFSGTLLSSSWITTWLCTFYCVKIATFRHPLLIYLKPRLPKSVPQILFGSITSSYLATFIVTVVVPFPETMNTANGTLDDNYDDLSVSKSYLFFIYGLEFSVSVPLILTLISLGLTIMSLSSHVLRTQTGASAISFSKVKGHIIVTITMSLLLIQQISYYLSQLGLHSFANNSENIWYWICLTIYYSFCPLQALILIMGSKKLNLACCACPN